MISSVQYQNTLLMMRAFNPIKTGGRMARADSTDATRMGWQAMPPVPY